MNLSEVKRSYTLGKVPKQVETAMRGWIEKYATVSNAIAELIANRMTDGVMSNTANYFFLDRADQSKLVDLKIETNAKDMKSMFASLKQLQKAFEQSPYKSIDYFLEILLLANRQSGETGSERNNADAFKKDAKLETQRSPGKTVEQIKPPDAVLKGDSATPVKTLRNTQGQIQPGKLLTPSPLKSVSIKIRKDETPSPDNKKRPLTPKDTSNTPSSNKIRKLPSSITIDVVKQDPSSMTGINGDDQGEKLFKFSPLLVKNPAGPTKQPKQVKVSIQRPGRTTPVSCEKIKKNREVKISVVPDRAKRDLTNTLNGPVATTSSNNLISSTKKSISPSKGVAIKIGNESFLNAENNNFWTRPVLPGVVNTSITTRPCSTSTSGHLTSTTSSTASVSVATPITSSTTISVKTESSNQDSNSLQTGQVQVQNSAVGIPVVVQCIRAETVTDEQLDDGTMCKLTPCTSIAQCNLVPSSSNAPKVLKQKYPSKFQCKICHKGFTRNTTLMTHTRTHTGERPYECDVCGKKFNTTNYLKSHKLLHSGDRPFVCPITECAKSFTQSATLRVHMKVHTGEKPHVCDYCHRSFATSGDLTKHVRTHTQERPYKCPVCNHGFNQNGNLRRHQQKLGHYDHKALHNAIRVKIIPKLEPQQGST